MFYRRLDTLKNLGGIAFTNNKIKVSQYKTNINGYIYRSLNKTHRQKFLSFIKAKSDKRLACHMRLNFELKRIGFYFKGFCLLMLPV